MKNILKLFIVSLALFIFSTLSVSAATLSLKKVGSYDVKGEEAVKVVVSGNYAYIVDYSSLLQILDISIPSSPKIVELYNVSGFGSDDNAARVKDVAIVGQYAYIALGNPGFIILDISNPKKPILLGKYSAPFVGVGKIIVSGKYAYSISRIFDISKPDEPVLVSSMSVGSNPIDIAIQGDYAYIADTNGSKLHIVDISKSLSPTLIGSIKTRGAIQHVTVNGKYAYVGNGWAGLTIIDISDPKKPSIKDTASTTDNEAEGVFVSGDYTFVAEGTSKKLRIFDTSNSSAIVLVGEISISTNILKDVFVSGNHAYIAAGASGLRIVQIKSQTEYQKDVNANAQFAETLKGKILLQMESKGEAWYVNPKDGRKYALGKSSDALTVIKKLGIGISNANLAKIPRNGTKDKGDQAMMNRLKGKILIQTQGKGEAWYVHPVTGKRYSLGKSADALAVIKKLGIGVSNNNLNKVQTGLVVK